VPITDLIPSRSMAAQTSWSVRPSRQYVRVSVLAAGAVLMLIGLMIRPGLAQSVVQPSCPPGYQLSGGVCVLGAPAAAPAPTCPPGFVFDVRTASCIAGTVSPQPPLRQPPRRAAPTIDIATELQRELKRIGCLTGRVDGVWGRGSRSALQRFSQQAGLRLGSQPTQLALNEARATDAGYCRVASNPRPAPRPSGGGGSGDWYAIAISSTSRNEAQRVANRLGAGWFVMNTRECPNFRNGYWIATAGGYSKSTAQQYVNQAGGDAYRKTCN
jgi:hypothetical protein